MAQRILVYFPERCAFAFTEDAKIIPMNDVVWFVHAPGDSPLARAGACEAARLAGYIVLEDGLVLPAA